MIFITQIVYVHPGKENEFESFENRAIPIISRYNGELVLRLRPDRPAVIDTIIGYPYEVHIVRFESEKDLEHFMHDEERKSFLHLKDESVKDMMIIKGSQLR